MPYIHSVKNKLRVLVIYCLNLHLSFIYAYLYQEHNKRLHTEETYKSFIRTQYFNCKFLGLVYSDIVKSYGIHVLFDLQLLYLQDICLHSGPLKDGIQPLKEQATIVSYFSIPYQRL